MNNKKFLSKKDSVNQNNQKVDEAPVENQFIVWPEKIRLKCGCTIDVSKLQMNSPNLEKKQDGMIKFIMIAKNHMKETHGMDFSEHVANQGQEVQKNVPPLA